MRVLIIGGVPGEAYVAPEWSSGEASDLADDAGLERAPRELGALAVLRQVADAEQVEQRAQVALDRLDAEEQLVGDLAVGARARERRAVERPAQRGEDAPLRL